MALITSDRDAIRSSLLAPNDSPINPLGLYFVPVQKLKQAKAAARQAKLADKAAKKAATAAV